MKLFYLAKPIYGGWVSFTAHLAKKYDLKLYKIGNKTEVLKNGNVKLRPFGYDVNYQNIGPEDIVKTITNTNEEGVEETEQVLITAIDKTYYSYLEKFPDGTRIVIHDPTEIKSKESAKLVEHLKRFKVNVIRESMIQVLKDKLGIDAVFLYHPLYEFPIERVENPDRAVSISRIDFDKHTDITLRASYMLDEQGLKPITLYGYHNEIYEYHYLREKCKMDLKKYWKGYFKKSYEELGEILKDAKYVVDMSAIKGDGGGSQYTFLEAIHYGCVLILNKQWIENQKTNYIHGENCFIVGNSEELVELLKNNLDCSNIVKNAKKLLEPHINVNWL
jgi:hypothetical protein